MKLLSPIEKRNYLIACGLEFIPIKHNNGKYTIDVYKEMIFYKSGIVEYKCYHTALIDTENIFYNAIIKQNGKR